MCSPCSWAANNATITGTGLARPKRVIDNQFFVDYLDTTDEWIQTRTGIRQRYFAAEDETTVSLAHQAAAGAIKDAGLQPSDIGMVVLGTVTPDRQVSATACKVAHELGCDDAPPSVVQRYFLIVICNLL